MKNDKSPDNDGLKKEFYETFWEEIKTHFSNSIRKSFLTEELSTSQKQAVIKKDRDKRLIKNWRPISLLNVDSKLISNSLANRLQDLMPNLVSENQSVYVNNRFIRDGGRLISDIMEIIDSLRIDALLMTIDRKSA